MGNELKWNTDLIKLLEEKLNKEFPDVKIFKGRILKDVSIVKDSKSGENIIQFGFVDQDIVIYKEEIDISDFFKTDKILIHKNNSKKEYKKKIIIPILICELKFNGINSHGLITYSEYASDIKSIFPNCKYWLVMRYRNSSSENKLKRHGKNFDKIIYFDPEKKETDYNKGDFISQYKTQSNLEKIVDEYILEIKKLLKGKKTAFIK